MTTSVEALVLKLLAAVSSISGYPMPERVPEVAFVPQSELQERACTRPCDIKGWFPPGQIVYLDERLDPRTNIWEQSILLHELVHYLQQEEGAFTEDVTCEVWLKREAEAYEVQYHWLVAQQVSPRLLRRISRPFLRLGC